MEALGTWLLEAVGRKGRQQVSQTHRLGGVKEGESMEIPEVAAPKFPALQCHDLEMMNRNPCD